MTLGSAAAPSPACRAFVGLGANLGDPARSLAEALDRIDLLPGTRVIASSARYRSAPVGGGGPDYVNQIAVIGTSLSPEALLTRLQAIEQAAGRQRGPDRNAPRTLDLDLLLFGDRRDAHCLPVKRASPTLTLPHPRMAQRLFVLMPLAELDPAVELPDQGPVVDLLARLLDSVDGAGQRCERLVDPGDPASRDG